MGLSGDHDIDRLCYGARAVKVPSGELAPRDHQESKPFGNQCGVTEE